MCKTILAETIEEIMKHQQKVHNPIGTEAVDRIMYMKHGGSLKTKERP